MTRRLLATAGLLLVSTAPLQAGDPNYNPAIDVNSDGLIDILDFGVFGMEFNRTDCLD